MKATDNTMGQSLVRNYLHIIFSTKHRAPLIDGNIEARLHEYLGGICRGLECPPVRVGGDVDHVHIVCMLSKKLALTKLMELVKSHSSKWIKEHGNLYQKFYWQDGYSAFSVSESQVDAVVRYVDNQRERHKKVPFRDELISLLKAHGLDYDERYIWE